jgi:hypothetical protein
MQAEIVALFDSFPELSWFLQLDNQRLLSIFDGSGQADSHKTHHYQNKIAFRREQIREKVIQPVCVRIGEMLADHLTKPFGGAKMAELFGMGELVSI